VESFSWNIHKTNDTVLLNILAVLAASEIDLSNCIRVIINDKISQQTPKL